MRKLSYEETVRAYARLDQGSIATATEGSAPLGRRLSDEETAKAHERLGFVSPVPGSLSAPAVALSSSPPPPPQPPMMYGEFDAMTVPPRRENPEGIAARFMNLGRADDSRLPEGRGPIAYGAERLGRAIWSPAGDLAQTGTQRGVVGNTAAGVHQGAQRMMSLAHQSQGDTDTAGKILEYVGEYEQALQAGDEGVKGFLAKTYRGALSSLVTSTTGAAVGGAPGAILFASAGEMNDAYQDGLSKGLSGADLTSHVVRAGAIEATPAAFMQAIGMGGLEKILGNLRKTGLEKQVADPAGRGIMAALKQFGISTLQEVPEELVTEIGHNINQWYSGVDPDAITGAAIFDTAINTTSQTVMTMGLVNARNLGRGTAQTADRKLTETFSPDKRMEWMERARDKMGAEVRAVGPEQHLMSLPDGRQILVSHDLSPLDNSHTNIGSMLLSAQEQHPDKQQAIDRARQAWRDGDDSAAMSILQESGIAASGAYMSGNMTFTNPETGETVSADGLIYLARGKGQFDHELFHAARHLGFLTPEQNEIFDRFADVEGRTQALMAQGIDPESAARQAAQESEEFMAHTYQQWVAGRQGWVKGMQQRLREFLSPIMGKPWTQIAREIESGQIFQRESDLVPVEQGRLARPGETPTLPDMTGIPEAAGDTSVTVAPYDQQIATRAQQLMAENPNLTPEQATDQALLESVGQQEVETPAGPYIDGPDMAMPPMASPEQLQNMQQLGEQERAAQQQAVQDRVGQADRWQRMEADMIRSGMDPTDARQETQRRRDEYIMTSPLDALTDQEYQERMQRDSDRIQDEERERIQRRDAQLAQQRELRRQREEYQQRGRELEQQEAQRRQEEPAIVPEEEKPTGPDPRLPDVETMSDDELMAHARERGVEIPPAPGRKVDRDGLSPQQRRRLQSRIKKMNKDGLWAVEAVDGRSEALQQLWDEVNDAGIRMPKKEWSDTGQGRSMQYEDWFGAPENPNRALKPGIVRNSPHALSWDQIVQRASELGLIDKDAGVQEIFDLLRRAKEEAAGREGINELRIGIDEHFQAMERLQAQEQQQQTETAPETSVAQNNPQTINEAAIPEGALIYRNGEWHQAIPAAEGTILQNGSRELVDNFSDVTVDDIIAPGDPRYAQAQAEYQAQEDLDAMFSTADPQLDAERDHLLKRAGGNVDRAWTLYERQLRTMAQRGEPVDPARADAMRRALLGDQEQDDLFGAKKQDRPRRAALPPVEKPVQQQFDGMDDGMLFSTASEADAAEQATDRAQASIARLDTMFQDLSEVTESLQGYVDEIDALRSDLAAETDTDVQADIRRSIEELQARIVETSRESEQQQQRIRQVLDSLNQHADDTATRLRTAGTEAEAGRITHGDDAGYNQGTMFSTSQELEEAGWKPEYAARTQISGTSATYQRLKGLVRGDVLDYGAGKGLGAGILKADSYEPFAQGWTPTYKHPKDITKQYDTITSMYVLNVVPDDVRNDIVGHIGSLLKPGGIAYIATRGKDVLSAKTGQQMGDMEVLTGKGTYQKGFTQNELTSYIQDVLGRGYTVESFSLGSAPAAVRVTRSSESTDMRFSTAQSENMKTWDSGLDKFYSGTMRRNESIRLKHTPNVLQMLGMPDYPLDTDYNTLKKAIQKHHLPKTVLSQIANQLHDPLMVFDSATVPDGIVVMTDLQHQGQSVVVAVHLGKLMQRYKVNDIASIHPRSDDRHFVNWIRKGLLKYWDKEKASEWLQSRGLQLPSEGSHRGSIDSILDKSDFVKWQEKTGRLSTASDAEYMAAVERGDLESAQKMVDARLAAQGYDIDAYHAGSVADRFSEEYSGTGLVGVRSGHIFFGSDKEAVNYYADPETGRETHKYKLRMENPKEFDGGNPRDNADQAFIENFQEGTEWDGTITRNVVDGDQVMDVYTVPYNDDGTTTQAKLADPVTYDDAGNVIPLSQRGDPANPDMRYSTASREFSPGDYPDSLARIVNHTNLNYLKTRPDYKIAKGKEEPRNPNITPQQRGKAAEQVVNAVVKPAKIDELRALLAPNKPVVIVPVIGAEATSVNMLPISYADRLAEELGGTVWMDITKLEGAANTGATTKQRHHNVQRFEGPVPPADAQIIVVDDTPTSGDTLASLIDLLAANDRMPVAASVLANGQWGLDLKPTKEGIQKMLDKAGMTAVEFEHEFGYSPEHLTGLEAREYVLKGARGKEGLRSSFPARGSEGRISGRPRSEGPTQGPRSPGQVTEPSSPKFSTATYKIEKRNFPKVDHDPDSVGKAFAITRSATNWTPSKPWVIREDLGDYRAADLQEPLTAAEKRGTFRSHAEASRWVESHEGTVRFSTADDFDAAVPKPQQRRFQQAAFAALIQHGGDETAYKQAMHDQFGGQADKYLDAFREEYARRKREVLRVLQATAKAQPEIEGRPDLANIGETPEAQRMVDTVDQARNIEGRPETRHDADVEAEADRRLRENYDQERADIEAAGLAGQPIDDVQVVMARQMFNDLAKKAAASGDMQDIMDASNFANAYRETGSELARAMRQRAEQNKRPTTPAEKAFWLLEYAMLPSYKRQRQMDAIKTRMKEKLATADTQKSGQRRLDAHNRAHARQVAKRLAWLKRQGWDLTNLDAVAQDRKLTMAFMRDVSADRSSLADKLHEFRLSMMLSAPSTHIVNVGSSQAHAMWEMSAQRAVEASLNMVMRKPDAAQWGEFKYIFRAALNPKLWAQAWRNALLAVDLESQVLYEQVTGEKRFGSSWADTDRHVNSHTDQNVSSTKDVRGPAISGPAGRMTRIPLRALLFEDELQRNLFAGIEVGARAYRIAKAEGLTGQAREVRIAELMEDYQSDAWKQAMEQATRHMFQDEGGLFQRKAMELRNATEPGRWIIPFARTPMSLFRSGIRKSVGAPVALAMDVAQGRTGDTQVRHAAESVIAAVGMYALYSLLIAGGDDDDDLPRITGSNPPSKRKDRWTGESYSIPADSIRIGDRYFSYRRMEPFGSALSGLVTILENYRDAKNGKDALTAASQGWSQFTRQFLEHPMLQGVDDVVSAMENPEYRGAAFVQNSIGSFVPNLAKSVARAADPVQRERRGMDFAQGMRYTAMPDATVAPSKIDIWGREMQKGGTAAGRWLTPFRETKTMGDGIEDKLDRLIRTWNRKNPDAQYMPEGPARQFTHDKVQYTLTPEQWAEYRQKSGRYAIQILKRRRLNYDNPTERDIDAIRSAFTNARDKAKQELVREMKRAS